GSTVPVRIIVVESESDAQQILKRLQTVRTLPPWQRKNPLTLRPRTADSWARWILRVYAMNFATRSWGLLRGRFPALFVFLRVLPFCSCCLPFQFLLAPLQVP